MMIDLPLILKCIGAVALLVGFVALTDITIRHDPKAWILTVLSMIMLAVAVWIGLSMGLKGTEVVYDYGNEYIITDGSIG